MGNRYRDPVVWGRLIRPEGCPICQSGLPWDVIAELRTAWVTAGPRAPVPGYVCVVSKRHVVEPFELPDDERAAFWEDAMLTARAVKEATGAVKMGYEIHGYTIPHLHMHLFPRQRDESPERPAESVRSAADFARLAEAISRSSN